MRIRSIKPEFWTSPDVTCLDYFDRLLFIGLWSYVDDNGVGYDGDVRIASALFPDDLDKNPRETLASVSMGLRTLARRDMIERYSVAGRNYFHVTKWEEHQKIDRPSKSRKPLPSDPSAEPRDTLASDSRDTRDTLVGGTREQGNEGTREIVVPFRTEDSPGAIEKKDVTNRLVNEWLSSTPSTQRPPSSIVAHASLQIDALVRDGIPEAQIMAGLAEWWAGKYPPSTIPNYVARAVPKESTSTQRARRGMEIAQMYELQEREEQ